VTGPPFDPDLGRVLVELGDALPRTVRPEDIATRRQVPPLPIEDVIGDREIEFDDRTIPGPAGHDLVVTVLRRRDHCGSRPGIYYVHGGGLIFGTRFTGITTVVDWVDRLDAVAVTVEYRLAPEHPYPAAADDVYAGLRWMYATAPELGVDAGRVVIAGGSAGGGLAAGLVLRLRDERGCAPVAQLLMYPMLDDRNDTVSSHQIEGIGVWDRVSNETGWSAFLGDRRGTTDVPRYAAPAREADLSGLPSTYIDVGSAEVFRDEDVEYASRIWRCGGECELHVWAGGFHGFDQVAPAAPLSRQMVVTRTAWLERILHRTDPTNGSID
jgi:acetyl esterase/lipase